MLIRKVIGFVLTIAIFAVALIVGRVRADVVNVAPDVSGAVVQMPVHDNQFVQKGELLMEINPSHYQIAVGQAEANVTARAAELRMRRADAAKLNLERTKVFSLVDGYVTNLNVFRGDYATAGTAKLAIVDSHSF